MTKPSLVKVRALFYVFQHVIKNRGCANFDTAPFFLYFCKKNLEDMELPKDPMMLLSTLNMKLRDQYSSLDELCEDMQVDKSSILNTLHEAGFEYNKELNKFW